MLHLHFLWFLDLDVASGVAVHPLKQLVELLVRHNHLHLLLGSSVSVTNDSYHTTQLVSAAHNTTLSLTPHSRQKWVCSGSVYVQFR